MCLNPSEVLYFYIPTWSLRSADQLLLAVPKSGLRWDHVQNLLNNPATASSSLTHFKSLFKAHLLSLILNTN